MLFKYSKLKYKLNKAQHIRAVGYYAAEKTEKALYDMPLDEKAQATSQILTVTSRPQGIWSPLPLTSPPIITSIAITLAPLLLPNISGGLPNQDLCACCSLCLGCSSSGICSADSFTSVRPKLASFLNNFHSPLPIALALLYFSQSICHCPMCSVIYLLGHFNFLPAILL